METSNIDEGRQYLESVLQRIGLDTEYDFLKGSIFVMLGNFDDAIDHFQRMKDLRIMLSSEDLLNFGTAYFRLERYDEAINIYEEISRFSSDTEGVDEDKKQSLVNIAKCLVYKGEYDQASQKLDDLELLYNDDESIATTCEQLKKTMHDKTISSQNVSKILEPHSHPKVVHIRPRSHSAPPTSFIQQILSSLPSMGPNSFSSSLSRHDISSQEETDTTFSSFQTILHHESATSSDEKACSSTIVHPHFLHNVTVDRVEPMETPFQEVSSKQAFKPRTLRLLGPVLSDVFENNGYTLKKRKVDVPIGGAGESTAEKAIRRTLFFIKHTKTETVSCIVVRVSRTISDRNLLQTLRDAKLLGTFKILFVASATTHIKFLELERRRICKSEKRMERTEKDSRDIDDGNGDKDNDKEFFPRREIQDLDDELRTLGSKTSDVPTYIFTKNAMETIKEKQYEGYRFAYICLSSQNDLSPQVSEGMKEKLRSFILTDSVDLPMTNCSIQCDHQSSTDSFDISTEDSDSSISCSFTDTESTDSSISMETDEENLEERIQESVSLSECTDLNPEDERTLSLEDERTLSLEDERLDPPPEHVELSPVESCSSDNTTSLRTRPKEKELFLLGFDPSFSSKEQCLVWKQYLHDHLESIRDHIKTRYASIEFVYPEYEKPILRIVTCSLDKDTYRTNAADLFDLVMEDLDPTFSGKAFGFHPVIAWGDYGWTQSGNIEQDRKFRDEAQVAEWLQWTGVSVQRLQRKIAFNLAFDDSREVSVRPMSFYPAIEVLVCLYYPENVDKRDSFEALTFEDLEPNFKREHPLISPVLWKPDVLPSSGGWSVDPKSFQRYNDACRNVKEYHSHKSNRDRSSPRQSAFE